MGILRKQPELEPVSPRDVVHIEERRSHLTKGLMNRMFHDQDRQEMSKFYVDDMLVKSKEEDNHLDDLGETFKMLCKYQMKLNPRRVAALIRFISRSTDKCLPFFKTLKKAFTWMDECQQAFEELKKYLMTPPLLSPSKQGEELYLYLAVSPTAISSALVREEDRRQLPIYYTSRALKGTEERYPPMEKLSFAVYATTNNETKYEALLVGLKMAKTLGATELDVHSNSQLVVGQVNGDYKVKEERMLQYLNLVQHQMSRFHEVKLIRIPREQNAAVDQLAKSASSNEPNDELKVVQQSSIQAIEGTLYKKGFSLPYLKCLTPTETKYVLREIHEGVCRNHSRARSLSKKVIRARYYWPSIQADENQFVQRCDKCQRFTNLLHSPSEELTPMSLPWPFTQWGLDIMGPFPIGRRQLKFLVVAIDYFTKWIEAEPLAMITEKNIQNFVWKTVICWFDIPRVLVSDNGKQFDNPKFRQFSQELGIHNHYSSPGHP
uniref:Uncharacterized protein n=1 Tax=Fagus sylvatica TaxID=28930 RepID=A0A2N9HNZ2_FAGSY